MTKGMMHRWLLSATCADLRFAAGLALFLRWPEDLSGCHVTPLGGANFRKPSIVLCQLIGTNRGLAPKENWEHAISSGGYTGQTRPEKGMVYRKNLELRCRTREPAIRASLRVTHVGRDDPNAISWIGTDAIDASNLGLTVLFEPKRLTRLQHRPQRAWPSLNML
jgi:hypothetical protein